MRIGLRFRATPASDCGLRQAKEYLAHFQTALRLPIIRRSAGSATPIWFRLQSDRLLSGVLYFLDGDGEMIESGPLIAPSEPREAFMKLVACAFNLDVRDKTLLRSQFNAIGQLRTKLPCFRLQYARDFSTLPALRQLIVDQQIRNEAWT